MQTILEEAVGWRYSEKEATRRESPRHLLVLSSESLADSRSHPNDRTCLMLAVVNCQARTVRLFVKVQPCPITKRQRAITEWHVPYIHNFVFISNEC